MNVTLVGFRYLVVVELCITWVDLLDVIQVSIAMSLVTRVTLVEHCYC